MTALKGTGVTVAYNSNAMAAYINSADLQNTIAELESTHLGSTAESADAGLVSSALNMSGDWNATQDGFLGPDSLAGTKRTVAIVIGAAVTWTWTAAGDVGGFITNYQIQTTASGKITWSAQLRLSGLGVRTV
jgi:hypothetical protein